ncbi:MAG: RNA methyltransferase [Candidatus Dependentiae bacterium]|nr:RNA methyltransferase [Candidatus Dependentiae bacterium]
MKQIISIENMEIKSVAALKDSKERYAQGKFIAEGIRTVSTMVQKGMLPFMLYATEKLMPQAQELVADDHITLVSEQVLKKISQTTSPSGILAVFAIPKALAPHTITPGLVLANISDPGNMGTLIRTCAAMNIKSLVVVEGVDPYNPKVIQASAGTIAHVNIFSWDWQEVLENKKQLKLYALVVDGGKNPQTINKEFALLVIGSEAHGIPEQWLADCDERITIPMAGNTESLNAAVAGSIAAYEVFGK